MLTTQPRHTLDELARLGTDVFERQVRPLLQPDDNGKFVAVDVESGDFEINVDDYAAVSRLLNRNPSAEVWLMRAGYPAAYKMRHVR